MTGVQLATFAEEVNGVATTNAVSRTGHRPFM